MQYNIVFEMKFTITLLFALSCIRTLSRYGMTDTALGNAGQNSKPVFDDYFRKLKKMLQLKYKGLPQPSNEDLNKDIEEFANNNAHELITGYIEDVKYSLVERGFLKSIFSSFQNIHITNYHEILEKKDLEAYKDQLKNFEHGFVDHANVQSAVRQVVINDPELKKKVVIQFVKYAKEYVADKKIFESKESSAIVNKINTEQEESLKKGKRTKLLKLLNKDRRTKLVESLNKEGSSVTESTELLDMNSRTTKLTNSMENMGIRATKSTESLNNYKKTTVFERFNKFKFFKNLRKDTKDRTRTHISVFGIIVVICSVAATLALCMTVVYHITKKKKQPDISYSVIRMM